MESKQKYIEEEFELDEFFISQIHNFKHGASVAIADKIDRMKGLPSTPIVLVDIRKTHVDKYLDYINLKRYIK